MSTILSNLIHLCWDLNDRWFAGCLHYVGQGCAFFVTEQNAFAGGSVKRSRVTADRHTPRAKESRLEEIENDKKHGVWEFPQYAGM